MYEEGPFTFVSTTTFALEIVTENATTGLAEDYLVTGIIDAAVVTVAADDTELIPQVLFVEDLLGLRNHFLDWDLDELALSRRMDEQC